VDRTNAPSFRSPQALRPSLFTKFRPVAGRAGLMRRREFATTRCVIPLYHDPYQPGELTRGVRRASHWLRAQGHRRAPLANSPPRSAPR
jgi:hypothetical protein